MASRPTLRAHQRGRPRGRPLRLGDARQVLPRPVRRLRRRPLDGLRRCPADPGARDRRGDRGRDAERRGVTRRPPRLPADPVAHARLQQAGAPMTTTRGQCSARVPSGRTYYACMNRAKVERDGKWYCAIHDPERVKTKQAKWEADFQKRWDQQRADENAAEERARRLGMGRPHFDAMGKGLGRYTGGVVLTAEEADELIARLAVLDGSLNEIRS